MSVYIERDISQRFTFGSIAADFESLKERNGSQPCCPVNDCLVRPSVVLLGEEESDGSPLLQVAEDMVEDDISSRNCLSCILLLVSKSTFCGLKEKFIKIMLLLFNKVKIWLHPKEI
ncbi:E3 ubiquitin-protein ligase BAH1 [Trifolium repens]|nr:E3 ubiquitin-protein ligase BAH1 [Trifolium repens]